MAGNIWIHAILLVTTLGVGNILYYLWAKEESPVTNHDHSEEVATGRSSTGDRTVVHNTRPIVIWPFKSWTTRYIITDQRVIVKSGILNKRSIEHQARDIRQITTGATWLERLQGYGHIEVESHSGASIRLKSISNYKTVADSIRQAQSA